MLSALWLAFAGPPVFLHPLPDAPGEPAITAVASGRASLRRPCYALRCPGTEWAAGASVPRVLTPTVVPGAIAPLAPLRVPVIAARRYPLYSPATRRDWRASHASHTRVGTRFGYEAVRTPETELRMEFGTGYRLEPYADYGTAVPGPIASGRFELRRSVTDRAELTQQLQVETGRENTTMRQTIGMEIMLRPQWTLRSDIEMRHDTAADGGNGATDAESSLRVQYAF
jgi:hypothetical protein